jgi:Phosphoglycerate kinase
METLTQQGLISVVGGGDSVAALEAFGKTGAGSYVSTGGGATFVGGRFVARCRGHCQFRRISHVHAFCVMENSFHAQLCRCTEPAM